MNMSRFWTHNHVKLVVDVIRQWKDYTTEPPLHLVHGRRSGSVKVAITKFVSTGEKTATLVFELRLPTHAFEGQVFFLAVYSGTLLKGGAVCWPSPFGEILGSIKRAS